MGIFVEVKFILKFTWKSKYKIAKDIFKKDNVG